MTFSGKLLTRALPDQPAVITRQEVTERIFRLTNATGRKMKLRSQSWQDKWLASAYFIRLEVDLDKVEQPMTPKYPDLIEAKAESPTALDEPVFIDRNRPHLTRWKNLETLCIDGKHRVQAARLLGRKTILAYVGVEAIPHLGLDPDAKGFDYAKGVIHSSKGEGTPPFRNQTGNVRLRFMSSDKKPYHLDQLLPQYKKDKGFKVSKKMEAVSPPGWEDTVEKMKEDGLPAETAFKLAWWMKNKNYTPHQGGKGK